MVCSSFGLIFAISGSLKSIPRCIDRNPDLFRIPSIAPSTASSFSCFFALPNISSCTGVVAPHNAEQLTPYTAKRKPMLVSFSKQLTGGFSNLAGNAGGIFKCSLARKSQQVCRSHGYTHTFGSESVFSHTRCYAFCQHIIHASRLLQR